MTKRQDAVYGCVDQPRSHYSLPGLGGRAVPEIHGVTFFEFLKFASFFVAGMSAIWGLATRSSFDDDRGRKRLTAAGHVAVALVFCSGLIGVLSFGLETQQKWRDQDNARQKELLQQQEKLRAIAQHQLDLAEQRAEFAENRSLVLEKAEEQRSREVEIAQRISLGSARNLARTQAALAQLERVLQPLDTPKIIVSWKLPGNFPGGEPLMKRLAEFGRQLAADPTLATRTPGIRTEDPDTNGKPSAFSFTSSSSLFPQPTSEPDAWNLLMNLGARVSFFADKKSQKMYLDAIFRSHVPPALGHGPYGGDLGFDIFSTTTRKLIYRMYADELVIYMSDPIGRQFIRKNGGIVSIPDFDRSTMAIVPNVTWMPHLPKAANGWIKPNFVSIEFTGKTYEIGFTHSRYSKLAKQKYEELRTPEGFSIFMAEPLGHFAVEGH